MAASQEEAVSPEKLMDEVSDFYDNIEAIKTRLTDSHLNSQQAKFSTAYRSGRK